MSSVVLSGDSSGTVTLTVPSAAGTNTATLPAATGTVMVSGNQPAFSAYVNSAQTISNSVYTKIQLNAETFDTASCFDSTTNYCFTPTVAGYYQINANIYIADASVTGYIISSLYKNGSPYKYSVGYYNSTYGNGGAPISDVVYMNGSTDYIEYYVRQTNNGSSSLAISATSQGTYMSGSMVRAA